jgi:hypothetical protein
MLSTTPKPPKNPTKNLIFTPPKKNIFYTEFELFSCLFGEGDISLSSLKSVLINLVARFVVAGRVFGYQGKVILFGNWVGCHAGKVGWAQSHVTKMPSHPYVYNIG